MSKAKTPPNRNGPKQLARPKRSARAGGAKTPQPTPPLVSLEEIARRQGVKPYTGVQDFAGLWPEEFDSDEFLEWLAAERRSRREFAAARPRTTGTQRRKESA